MFFFSFFLTDYGENLGSPVDNSWVLEFLQTSLNCQEEVPQEEEAQEQTQEDWFDQFLRKMDGPPLKKESYFKLFSNM